MTEKKKRTGNVLKVLFPGEEVEICEGQKVKVTPLSLADLPKVIDAFSVVMQLAEKNVPPSDIAVVGCTELLKILPFCIDRPPEEIPVTVVPDVIDVVLRQNITDASVAKWKALVQRVSEQIPVKDLPVGQSIHSKK